MKRSILSLIVVLFLGLGLFLGTGSSFVASASGQEEFIIRAYGDSIAAGYGLEGYTDYENQTSDITLGSYPEIFSRQYMSTFGGEVLGKGVSGDTSVELLEDLTPYIEGTAEDMDSFNETDIITLCIGANNVLGPALANLENYIMGTIAPEQFDALLAAGVNQFKSDYPQILSAFEGKKVVVMTVYNPYKYTSVNDVSISENLPGSESLIRPILAQLDSSFQEMLSSSMTALQEINDVIRASASNDVYVVDIWNLFETFTETQYSQYINCDITKVVVESFDTASIMDQFSLYCDPHPTADGHAVIAEEHLNTFKYFEINSQNDFASLKDKTDKITLSLTTFEKGSYSYKWYKTISGSSTLLATTTTKSATISADDIAGEGAIYVEAYQNEQLIYTTQSIDYSVELNSYSISTQDSLTGLKDANETVVISVSTPSTENYNFKLVKSVGETKTLLGEGTTEFEVEVQKLKGSGNLFVEVYKKGTLVSTTNSLSFSISINTFEISTQNNLLNSLYDVTDEISINIDASDYSDYVFKLYKKVSNQATLLKEESSQIMTIQASMLEGSGEVYVEVYKNDQLVLTTNSLNFSISINRFQLNTREELAGVFVQDYELNVAISANKTSGYTYKLFKNTTSGTTLLSEFSTPSFGFTAGEIEGEGALYVEVYKNEDRIYTTNSILYEVRLGTFEIETEDDLFNLTDKQTIVINVVCTSVSNPTYILYRSLDQVKTKLNTNNTGLFELQAWQLEGEGELYVEVYSSSKKVATTNTLNFKYIVKEIVKTPTDSAGGKRILFVSGIAVGAMAALAIVGICFAIDQKRKLWK